MRRRLEKIERRTPTPSDAEQVDEILLVAVDPATGKEVGPSTVIWRRHGGR